jgi:hypothetical protein
MTAFAGAAIVLWLFAVIRSGGADEPADKVESPFTGKLVVINVKDQTTSFCLENVVIRRLGNRDFVVGIIVRADERFAALSGRNQWLAVDTISAIYEFKDLDEIKAVKALTDETQRQMH